MSNEYLRVGISILALIISSISLIIVIKNKNK